MGGQVENRKSPHILAPIHFGMYGGLNVWRGGTVVNLGGVTPSYYKIPIFGNFGHGSYTSRAPTTPISGGFVGPMGTTKPPEMGSVGHLEVSLKKNLAFEGGGGI